MSRCLLHKNKVEAFRQWLADKGIENRPPRGGWEILQVKIGRQWACLYARIEMPEHVTCDVRLERMVRQFIRDQRATLEEPQS